MATKKKTKKKSKPKRATKKRTKKHTKKKVTKRVVHKKKSAVKKPGHSKEQVIGVVTHYFPHVQAAVVKLKKPLSIGQTVLLKGETTNFEQKVESIQIDRVPIQEGKKGDEIGLFVKDRVREHDLVLSPAKA